MNHLIVIFMNIFASLLHDMLLLADKRYKTLLQVDDDNDSEESDIEVEVASDIKHAIKTAHNIIDAKMTQKIFETTHDSKKTIKKIFPKEIILDLPSQSSNDSMIRELENINLNDQNRENSIHSSSSRSSMSQISLEVSLSSKPYKSESPNSFKINKSYASSNYRTLQLEKYANWEDYSPSEQNSLSDHYTNLDYFQYPNNFYKSKNYLDPNDENYLYNDTFEEKLKKNSSSEPHSQDYLPDVVPSNNVEKNYSAQKNLTNFNYPPPSTSYNPNYPSHDYYSHSSSYANNHYQHNAYYDYTTEADEVNDLNDMTGSGYQTSYYPNPAANEYSASPNNQRKHQVYANNATSSINRSVVDQYPTNSHYPSKNLSISLHFIMKLYL